jgi:membrane-associated phospholipid phosphatase
MNYFFSKIFGCLFFVCLGLSTIAQTTPPSNPSYNNFLYDKKGTYRLLAETVLPVSFGIPMFYLAKGFIKKDRDLQILGLKYVGALVINEVMTDFVKYSIYKNNNIQTGFFSNPPRGDQIITSLPSRHSTTAFNTAATFSINNPKWYYVVPSYIWASSVVYARHEVGENYTTNLVGSVLIGAGSAYLNRFLIKILFEKKKKDKVMNNYLILK